MKLLFFGTSDFSRPVFEALKEEGYFPILWDLNNSLEDFKKLNPDICIIAAYGKIVPKEYLDIPKHGFLNIHPSLLPKYRGASPIQAAILNGDEQTGVTIILMDEKIDHGPILAKSKIQQRFPASQRRPGFARVPLQAGNLRRAMTNDKKYEELEKELAELGAKLLIETLPRWIKGEIKPAEQNHDEATYTKKFSWQDGKINWSKSAQEVNRQIRALNPEPGTWTTWHDKVLKIIEAKIYEEQPYHKHDKVYIGVVYEENKRVFVPSSIGHIEPLKVQLEGGKILSIKDFLNGHKDFIGSKLT
ncbi:MAG: methionyl-tRNA formyltransferase [Patescibacteria group bacterium]